MVGEKKGGDPLPLHDEDAQAATVGAAQADALFAGKVVHVLQAEMTVATHIDAHMQHAPL